MLVAVLAVRSAALADKKKPKDTTDTPKESVQLNYGSINWTYTQQEHPDTNRTPKSKVSGTMRR